MKRLIILSTLIVFLSFSYYAFSQYEDFSRSKGYEWASYSDSSKLGFTLGFMVGIHKALEELDIFIRQSSYKEKRIEDLLPIYDITNTQLKEGLDNFYKDPANMPVPIKDAVIIVCKEIKAKDIKEIEKEKRLLRLPPEERRIVARQDYLKQKIKRGEFPKYELKDEEIVEKETKEAIPLETEEEIVEFWTKQVFPEEASKVKKVVKVDYTLVLIITIISISALVLIFIIRTKKERKGRSR